MRAIKQADKTYFENRLAKKIQDGTYGFCEDTGEPIGLKRLMARPVATFYVFLRKKNMRKTKKFTQTIKVLVSLLHP